MKKTGKALSLGAEILAMGIFSTIGFVRQAIPLSSAAVAFFRAVIATVFLLLLFPLLRHRPDGASIRKNLWKLVLSGALIGFNWILLFEAYRYTSVAVATLCYYMAPIFVIVVSPFFLRERLTLYRAACVFLAFVGMVPVSGVLSEGGTGDFRGVLFGLGAAILYAAVVLLNKKIDGVPALDKTLLQLSSAGVILLPYILLTESAASLAVDGSGLWLLLLIGVLHTGGAYILYFYAIGRLPAQTAAIFSYIDPVGAVLLSAIFTAEGSLDPFGWLGALLILGAAVASEWPPRRAGRRSASEPSE